jgi:hypothetical protein
MRDSQIDRLYALVCVLASAVCIGIGVEDVFVGLGVSFALFALLLGFRGILI